jgi:hypothetical protein
MALSPRLKRSSVAKPSSRPRARKKLLNTRGVSSTTSARKPAREPGREPGRPTSSSRCRLENDSSFSESDFQRTFRRKCRIQVDRLLSSCRLRHDPQPRTPTTRTSIAVLSPRTDGRSHRAGHVGCLEAWTTCSICTGNGDVVLGRTPCLILNMDSIFAVLMMPSPMRKGACHRAMIGPKALRASLGNRVSRRHRECVERQFKNSPGAGHGSRHVTARLP